MRTAIFAAITLSSSLAFAGLAPEEVGQLRAAAKTDVATAVEAVESLNKGTETPAGNDLSKVNPNLGTEAKIGSDDLDEIDDILDADRKATKISDETK